MKKVIIVATIMSTLFFHHIITERSLTAQTNSESSSHALPLVSNPPSQGTLAPPGKPEQSQAFSRSATASLSAITPTSDISLLLKEMLSTNNQVVSQVAQMYQNLGLFITIIVTLVGVIATLLAFLARRSVQGFIHDWTKKMENLEKDMKASLNRLHETVFEAETSAKKAAGYEESFKENIAVLNKSLEKVDRLQTDLQPYLAQTRVEEPTLGPPLPSVEDIEVPHSSEPSTAEEDAEVEAYLKGKIDPEGGTV
jgi:hypothetical protein